MPVKRNKLLIIGSFEDKGALELQYSRGFIKQGWEVYGYEIQHPIEKLWPRSLLDKAIIKLLPNIYLKKINKGVLAHVRELKPDVVLIFKGMQLYPETVAQIKKYTTLLCNYNPDHPLEIYSKGGTNQNIISSVQLYDVFFTYSFQIVRKIIALHKIDSYCIPFGFNPELPEKYAANYEETNLDTFLFVGAWDKAREEMLNTLNRVDIDIYGDPEWKTRTHPGGLVHKNYKQKKLYNKELYYHIRSSIGVLNILRQQNIVEASHNMRTFEVPGYGGLLLSPFTDEQASFFEPDKEAVYFGSLDDLNSKMDHLKLNPNIVKEIKKNALYRSMSSGYSYDNRAIQMLSYIEAHLNN